MSFAETKFESLLTAIRGHNEYARNATQGLGVDRLLQGLRRQAVETNMPIHELFNDPGVLRSARYLRHSFHVSFYDRHDWIVKLVHAIQGLTSIGVKE